MKEYALYKGDELLYIGTMYQLMEKYNIKENTFRFYMTPTYKKRLKDGDKKRRLICVSE